METVKVKTSQHIDIDYPVAGIGERVAAYLIDYGIFIAVYAILLFSIGLLAQNLTSASPYLIPTVFITFFALFVFYDLLCEVFMNGQSFGKKIIKIKVVSLDGGQPSMGQYFIRWIFRIVDFTLTLSLGGFVCVIASDKKQRIGDIVAGTTLIKTKQTVKINQIAFHPVHDEYVPIFTSVAVLSDYDISLVHEVLRTYYLTRNAEIIYKMSEKVMQFLGIALPSGMNELQFLNAIVLDYNHETSKAI